MSYQEENEIDLNEVFSIIWYKKSFILVFTSIFAIFSIFYSLSLSNIYTSSALLAPTSKDDTLSSKLGSYSSFAGLAGINVTQQASKSQEAVERIKSYEFYSKYFLPNIKFENLLAVKNWTPNNNYITYNDNIFDSNKNKWIDGKKPTLQDGFSKYKKSIFINTEKETGFVFISIDHNSPIIAKKWLDIIILNINESMRELDKKDAQNAINFLNTSSRNTNIQSIKEVISSLLENQMQTLMLASSNNAYIFKTIDSPIAPEKKSAPSRALICILITLLGGIISLIIVFIMHKKEDLKK